MLGLFVQKHAEAVQRLHDVSVLYVTADNSIADGKAIIEKRTHAGIAEHLIYFPKSPLAIINFFRYLLWYFRGMNMLPQPDLIHVHILTRTGIPALYYKWFRGIPFVITEHWSRYLPQNLNNGSYKGFLRKFATRLVVKNAAAVTTVTQNLAQSMQALGLRNRYEITPNVVDISLFTPATGKESLTIKKLIHVSCFDEPAKNIKGIIDAASELTEERIDFNLTIVGDGRDYKEVKAYADKKHIPEGRIRFTGLLEGTALTEEMKHADAMVMFSNYENLPCTIVESMSLGVPVISTDVGGIREHLGKEFGILIEPRDKEALKSAIRKVLDGKITFEREKMRVYAREHFSYEELGNRFDRIYREAGLK